ncbi:hypothetical protein INS49_000489 [Diaporthe citri]|uniref:uncharacterized protein n=1 Tax=Diaporthe citri TaxID=83186 RepID=UPI001C802B07|nr:uncharacterized protein INS49_000489 [Diaporthe citri]KAG6366312.1 hypothetical protein INS49_000489 [Diaporthe citri]
MSSEGNLKTYRGNCHCGAFIYEARLPEITSYTECNCSICRKKGYAYLVPEGGQVDVVKGSIDELTSYAFNTGGFVHRFCPNCGTAVLAQTKTKTIINAIGPAYEPVAYKGPEPAVDEGGKIYHGSCHCGAVTLAVKVDKPLEARDITVDEERIVECNCSICMRGAYVWIYPHIEDTVIEGREHLAYRSFNKNVVRKAFCKHCGTHVCNEPKPLTDAEIEALNDAAKAWRDRSLIIRTITLRVLDDFDFKTVKTNKLDGWDIVKPLYVNP